MKIYKTDDFNTLYLKILKDLLLRPMFKITNRKGELLHEITNFNLVLTNLDNCYCFCRNLNLHYLIGETIFYIKGENKLYNIEYYSKFWKKLADDGENLNSCYGYYIWKQPLINCQNQFEYCKKQLEKNSDSKKAVITIYDAASHSKETKDNPCTMFLQFYIRENKLYLKTQMRSNDIWFGLPYDLPFFVLLQKTMYFDLKFTYRDLELGDYTHSSNSLHAYERNFDEIKEVIKKPHTSIEVPTFTKDSHNYFINLIIFEQKLKNKEPVVVLNEEEPLFIKFFKKILYNFKVFEQLEIYAKENSTCLKKQVACVFINNDLQIITKGYSGRPEKMGKCKECVRKSETFFQDGCNSLHSEERAIIDLAKFDSIWELQNSTCYLTHAPCDQCLKFLIEVGVKKVIFKEAYKTHFERYSGFIEIEDGFGRKYV
jgi:thymidylate synthase